jgi:hypothetical protein
MWHRRDPREARLAAECEAFLSGALPEALGDADGPPPAWTWLNLLAHGGVADLQAACAQSRAPVAAHSAEWVQARAFLAGEILDRAATPEQLARLQRDVLVPLELELASRPGTGRFRPQDLVTAVLGALPSRSRRHEHP